MTRPRISVIIPVYKVEAYLRRCIDSIINQSFRDLEIILVDDGSPDIETSLSLLRYMESLGLREVWLTPHIMEDYPSLNQKLQQRFEALRAA